MDDKLRDFVWQRDRGLCQLCGRKLTGKPDSLDLEKRALEELSGLKEIPIYKWIRTCWSCEKKTTVVSYNFAVFNSHHIGSITKLDEALAEKYSFVKKVYSKTMGREVIANTCIHCGSLQGNWFVMEDLLELPYEVDMNSLIDLNLTNNLTTEDLHIKVEEPRPPKETRLRIGHIHHKDLNWENNDNDNLILLCEDCHFKAHSLVGKKTSAVRSRKEETRIRREKKQADKWRSNYYKMKTTPRKKVDGFHKAESTKNLAVRQLTASSETSDSPSELFKKTIARRDRAKRPRY